MNILFLGDIFGNPGIKMVQKHLEDLIKKHKIDFVIAQSENASGRKGLEPREYNKLKKAGVNAFTLGNHVWAKRDIKKIINNSDVIRPLNVDDKYEGNGSRVFRVGNKTLRVTQMMGITFNDLYDPWKQKNANNFFDAFDELPNDHDFHIIDFHAETTSEKNVFGLYVDGKVNAFLGTHTHVQTSDERIMPKGTAYITDVGMVGPNNSAIGASYESVYQKMRYDTRSRFEVSDNKSILCGVVIDINDKKQKITRIFLHEK